MYCRVANYPIEEVLPFVLDTPRSQLKQQLRKEYKAYVTHYFDEFPVKMDSLRYQLFKQKGVVCCCCQLQGEYFGLEVESSNLKNPVIPYHFNLYAVRNGKEIMITKDHIFPKSKGGKDILDNMQTMCYLCNEAKGNEIV